MFSSVEKVLVTVSVDGDLVSQDVYVDISTGLDVDPENGIFRTRSETEQLIREVYRIGKDALPKELERYNKWMRSGSCVNMSEQFLSSSSVVRNSTYPFNIQSKTESVGNWKKIGNDAIQRGDLRKAIRCYDEALYYENSLSILWSNRAEALIRLKRGNAALLDAEKAIKFDSMNVKAYYRKASALILIGSYTAAYHYINDSEKEFGTDVAWQSLRKRIEEKSVAILLGDRWVSNENVAEGEELCTLEGLQLPSNNVLEVLCLWAKNGVPPEFLEKEMSYYAARQCEPTFNPYDGIIIAQKLQKQLFNIDPTISFNETEFVNILRWSCLLLETYVNSNSWLETIFGDAFIVFGASLFKQSPVGEGNVTFCFDEASHRLHVVAHRYIERYETLYLVKEDV